MISERSFEADDRSLVASSVALIPSTATASYQTVMVDKSIKNLGLYCALGISKMNFLTTKMKQSSRYGVRTFSVETNVLLWKPAFSAELGFKQLVTIISISNSKLEWMALILNSIMYCDKKFSQCHRSTVLIQSIDTDTDYENWVHELEETG